MEKKLLRQVKRERKGAERELRRDAEFLARERDRDNREAEDARRAIRKKNLAWMEDQAGTFNQQVRIDKGALTGAGSSIKKSVAAVLKTGKRGST